MPDVSEQMLVSLLTLPATISLSFDVFYFVTVGMSQNKTHQKRPGSVGGGERGGAGSGDEHFSSRFACMASILAL